MSKKYAQHFNSSKNEIKGAIPLPVQIISIGLDKSLGRLNADSFKLINYSFGNNNINYNTIINDYRTKLKINKNKLNNNNLIKASSLNNNLKKSIKNLGINCYNLKSNKKNNNILIDDTTSNDTDVLTESGNNNKETNLYVYRSEVHYPVKNIISNFNLPKNPYNSNYNYCNSTLNSDIDKYKSNEFLDSNKKLVENLSKSVGNSFQKKRYIIKLIPKITIKIFF